jgi:hypothetical protein
MIPAPSFEYIDHILNDDFFEVGHHPAKGIKKNNNVVGFVFFDQNFKRAPISDFIENIDLLNKHSGKNIHFFLPGISLYGVNSGEKSKEIGCLNNAPIFHNAKAFNSFRVEFEHRIPSWRYGYGVDIVLIDVVEVDGLRKLDFESAIFFKVEEFIREGIVNKTSELIGKIIKYRTDSGLHRVREIQNAMTSAFREDWIKALILSIFPKSISSLARGQAVLAGGRAVMKFK